MSKCHGIAQRIAEITRISTQISGVTEHFQSSDNTDAAVQRLRHGFVETAQQQHQQQAWGSNSALQDYERQKILLEQQKEKRRLALL